MVLRKLYRFDEGYIGVMGASNKMNVGYIPYPPIYNNERKRINPAIVLNKVPI